MATEIKIPLDLWEEDTEAAVTNWLVSDGGTVQEGALVAEIMTEKVTHEINAPASGTVRIGVPVDGVVKKGDVIGTIE